MFIKEIKKKDTHSKLKYTYHRLVESYRTPKGPRHRIVLNLGHLDLPGSEWKDLANRIEEITKGMKPLFPVSEAVETLAKHYAKLLSERTINTSALIEESVKAEYYDVDINSIKNENLRSIGAEHACTERG